MYSTIFLIALLASTIGAVVGIGGGIIIKPVLDFFCILPVSTVSFLSGCTVLAMSCSSLIRTRKSDIKIDLRKSTMLAVGAIFGGVFGRYIFELLLEQFENEKYVGIVQTGTLFIINVIVFLYLCNKERVKSKKLGKTGITIITGLMLGIASSFLGIGGGPYNVALLQLLFSMDAKTSAKNSIYIIFFSQVSGLLTTVVSGTIPNFSIKLLLLSIGGGIGGAILGGEISKRITIEQTEKILIIVLIMIMIINILTLCKYT